MSARIVPVILVAAMAACFGFSPVTAQEPPKPQPPPSLRLYVLDCGIITPVGVEETYGLKPNEMATIKMVTPCFLIVHPRGSLIWDTGEIPDSAFKDGVSPQKLNAFTVDRPLLPQLAAIGYTPANITYMALSHYHRDHVANASLFAGSTWIVQKGDRDPIFAPRPTEQRMGAVPDPKFFEGLANSRTIVLNGEDHDVFGDGSVIIKYTHRAIRQDTKPCFSSSPRPGTSSWRATSITIPKRSPTRRSRPSTRIRPRPRRAARWSKTSSSRTTLSYGSSTIIRLGSNERSLPSSTSEQEARERALIRGARRIPLLRAVA